MCPHLRGGGHTDFGVDPIVVGVGMALSCLHLTLWTIGWILTKFSSIYIREITKNWLDFGDLDLMFKVPAVGKLKIHGGGTSGFLWKHFDWLFLILFFYIFSFYNTIMILLSKLTNEKRKDFCFVKMFVRMIAKLIFERAMLLGVFTGSPVFIKPTKFIWSGNPGSSCSKLTMLLVNNSLKFTLSDTQIRWIFCWKNVSSFCSAKAIHIFSAKNIRILYIESAKTVNKMILNKLVKLTTLWTTGPWSYHDALWY